jgi:hypothetical protein
MPENQFYFTPDNLHIENAEFKGVQTFAGQIMHLATDNILIWSAVTGDSARSDIEGVNGLKALNNGQMSYVQPTGVCMKLLRLLINCSGDDN